MSHLGVVQLGRTLDLGSRGRGFKPLHLDHATVAKQVYAPVSKTGEKSWGFDFPRSHSGIIGTIILFNMIKPTEIGVVSTKRNDATGKNHGSNAYNQIRNRSMKDLL